MAAGKKRPARTAPSKRGAALEAAEQLLFAVEIFRDAHRFMGRLRVSPEVQREASRIAQRRSRQADGAAKRYLERVQGLGELLSHWQSKRPFVDSAGHPKVLAIRGTGTTLQSLARRYVPKMPLTEVIKLLTSQSDVKRVSRGKVALLGTTFLLVPKTRNHALATLALGIKRYGRAIVHNSTNPKEKGEYDRTALVPLSNAGYRQWLRDHKDPLQNHLVEIEASLRRYAKGRKRRATGFTTFAFRD